MNNARLKQELVALRERVDRQIDELLEQIATDDEAAANDSPWKKLTTLAREVDLSPKTISRYIAEARPLAKGEPHPFATGEGRRVRVHSERFERWRATR